MKTFEFLRLTSLTFILTSLCISFLFAQWEPDRRLTFNYTDGLSYTNMNNAWCIAARGDTVDVVWEDNRGLGYEIYSKRTTDGGVTWSSDTRLTFNADYAGWHHSMAEAGNNIYTVWRNFEEGNNGIFFKRSTGGGVTWGPDIPFIDVYPYLSYYPNIAASGTDVHVVWYDMRDGLPEIYYKRSTNRGETWDSDTRLTYGPHSSEDPSIAVSGATVHVVWEYNTAGNYGINYKRSTDGGRTWCRDTCLTFNPLELESPSIAVSGTNVHVVWVDYRDWNYEVYYKCSKDGGVVWGPDTRLTNKCCRKEDPSIIVSEEKVHVVWNDYRDGKWEIYYKRNPTGNQ